MPPLGENIPFSVETFPVDDSVPTEEEMEWEVTRLLDHRSRGPSGMSSKHLKGWLAEAQKKEREEAAADQNIQMEGMTSGPDGNGKGGDKEDQLEDACR